jgi:hypothetical protein
MSKELTPLEAIHAAIEKHGLPTVKVLKGRCFYRVQLSVYTNPIFYNRDSDSRYGDGYNERGVFYVAGSDGVAVAEALQQGKGTPVLIADLYERTLHTLKSARHLNVIDAAALARNSGQTLEAIVRKKGQSGEGYAYTRLLSAQVMRHAPEIDGLIYPSRAYPITGSINGCNLVLFEGRSPQLVAVNHVPLMDCELSNGETALDLLTRIQVPVR